MSTRWPIEIVPVGPIAAGAVAWREKGQVGVTIVAKATLTLVHGGLMRLTEPVALVRADQHFERSPVRSIEAASDLAVYRSACDVTFKGHAYAPPGRPQAAMTVRLGIFRGQERVLDKALHVFGDRAAGGAPKPFQRMPIAYERAAGSKENPVGVAKGAPSLPNVVDPRDPATLAGFGPISRYWPQRKKFTKDQRVRFDQAIVELGDDFGWEYFQAAPPDQRVAFLHGDEWLVLDGLHPALPRLQTQLPGVWAEARVATYGGEIAVRRLALVADSLEIDGDLGIASIAWRGRYPVSDERALGAMRAAVGILAPNAEVAWPELREMRPPTPSAGAAATAQVLSGTAMFEGDAALASALPFGAAGTPAPPREEPSDSLGRTAYIDPDDSAVRKAPVAPFPIAPPADPNAPLRSGAIPWQQPTLPVAPQGIYQEETQPADGPLPSSPPPPPLHPPPGSPRPASTPAPPLGWGGALPPPSLPLAPAPPVPPQASASRFFHRAEAHASTPDEPPPGPEPPRRKSPAVPIVNTTSLTVATMPWQVKPPQDSLTVIVKGTFDLVPNGPARLRDEGDPPIGDVPIDDDETKSTMHGSDYAIFKPKVDVTVVGSAYAPGGRAPAAQVEMHFASIRRKLAVFGDRTWKRALVRTAMSNPEPFTSIPLTFERAFGGAHHPTNPVGIGFKGAGGDVLPNLEAPDRPIASPGDTPPTMCFAPIPLGWPERTAKLGTYGGRWLKTRWPYFPDDFDWHHFQNAPPSQQLESVRGDEEFSFVGMHPAHPRLEGTLPALRARAFMERTPEAGGGFEEVRLKLDTVAFDVDAMKLELVWRGLVPVSEEEAPELNALYVMHEPLGGAPLPIDEARARDLAAALPLEVVEDEPEGAPAVANDVTPEEAAEEAEAKKLEAELEAQERGLKEELLAAGIDLDAPVPEPPPPSPEAIAEAMRGGGSSEAEIAETLEALKALKAEDEGGEAASPSPDLRAEVIAALAADRSLEGLDLAGADLRDLDFSGRSLAGSSLKDAKLERASFTGANLTGALLAGADLGGARLDGAVLTDADATGARLEGATLAGAKLGGAELSRVNARGASFEGAEGEGTQLVEADLTGASFDGARLGKADLSRAKLDRATFRRAEMPSARLYDAVGSEVLLDEAKLPGARAEGVKLTRSSLKSAELGEAIFENADVTSTTFYAANLVDASFERARAEDAVFTAADMRGARLRRAKLARAQFLKTNLMNALFERADLTGADLRGANLHAVETWRAKLDGAKLDLAIVTRSKLAKGPWTP